MQAVRGEMPACLSSSVHSCGLKQLAEVTRKLFHSCAPVLAQLVHNLACNINPAIDELSPDSGE